MISDRDELSRIVNSKLRELGAYTLPDLIRIIDNHQELVSRRYDAIRLLGSIGALHSFDASHQTKAVDSLDAVLREQDPALNWEAAMSLGKIGGEKAVEILISAIAREKHGQLTELKLAALHALGLTGSQRAVPELLSILNDVDEPDKLRGEAAEALAYCGRNSESATHGLIRALQDTSPEVRLFSAFALGELGNPDAIPALEGKVEDSEIVFGRGTVGQEAKLSLERLRQSESPPL